MNEQKCPATTTIATRTYACQRPQVQSGRQKRHWRHEYTAPLAGDATITIRWTEPVPGGRATIATAGRTGTVGRGDEAKAG